MKKLIEKIKKALGMDKKSPDTSSQGFTLIELLVVIAIIGILAAALLIAIDPLEQIRRAQDSSRKQVISALGRAVESYYINSASGTTSAYPDGTDWISADLAGEFKNVPSNLITAPACTGGELEGNVCLKADITTNTFVVYGYMESKSEKGRITTTPVCASGKAYYIYSSSLGKAGIICATTEPANNFSGDLY